MAYSLNLPMSVINLLFVNKQSEPICIPIYPQTLCSGLPNMHYAIFTV